MAKTQTHTIFSAAQVPAIRKPSGSIVEMFTHEENGGNIDNPALIKGTKVYFPIYTEGALFSIGD